MRQLWTDYRIFWREFRRTFHTTGAVLPSGRALAAALTHYVRQPGNGRRILEIGPGTGSVTAHIAAAMQPEDRLTLVERNEQFVARVGDRLSSDPKFQAVRGRTTLHHLSVEELAESETFDVIVSGLPLNNFSCGLVEQILAKLGRLLSPAGTLSFFEYIAIREAKSLVSSRAERHRLGRIGMMLDQLLNSSEVRRDCVLTNVPPAWVHHVRGLGTRG